MMLHFILVMVEKRIDLVLSSQSECSACYQQTSHICYKKFYLVLCLFDLGLYVDVASMCRLHIDKNHSLRPLAYS